MSRGLLSPTIISQQLSKPRLHPKNRVKEILQKERVGNIVTLIVLPLIFSPIFLFLFQPKSILVLQPQIQENQGAIFASWIALIIIWIAIIAFDFIYWYFAYHFYKNPIAPPNIDDILAEYSDDAMVDISQFVDKKLTIFLTTLLYGLFFLMAILIPIVGGFIYYNQQG